LVLFAFVFDPTAELPADGLLGKLVIPNSVSTTTNTAITPAFCFMERLSRGNYCCAAGVGAPSVNYPETKTLVRKRREGQHSGIVRGCNATEIEKL